MDLIKEYMPHIMAGFVIALILAVRVQEKRKYFKHYTTNDLSKDSTRWSEIDLMIAVHVALFVKKEIRLNNHFSRVMYAILKRTQQAVDKKMCRIKTVGERNSTASVQDEMITLGIASLPEEEAHELFFDNLEKSGATLRQIAEIKKYL